MQMYNVCDTLESVLTYHDPFSAHSTSRRPLAYKIEKLIKSNPVCWYAIGVGL